MITMTTSMMKKTIAAGTVALMLAGASLALAQQGPREHREFGRSAEDVAAFTDARIAALKAGLKLSAEQEKNWPALETALRELATARADRRKEWRERLESRRERMESRREARRDEGRGGDADQADRAQRSAPDSLDRLRRAADAIGARAAGLKKLVDAADPLYKGLDDGQKRRFAVLLHMRGPGRGGFHRRSPTQ